MIGQLLGRYRIESRLGEGGMGVVYLARDTQLARPVAIKVLAPDALADPDRKRRFIQEAQAASALNHPHIITIYDVSTDGQVDFIVMEYVAGTTLDRVIPPQGLPLRRALDYAAEVADALAKAHDSGIIHRDLKPSNLIVTADAGVKVLDFGIAKLLQAEPSGLTRTDANTAGVAIGTPAYMSPEQAEGRPVDGRTDIFSLGSVLYEMVTGRPAFAGESRLSVMAKILNEDPAPPSKVGATLPPDVEKAIMRCLRKDPARRFQTMADLKVALEDLALDSSTTQPAVTPASTDSGVRQWRWIAAALAIVVLAAVLFIAKPWRQATSVEPLRSVPLTSLSGVVRQPSLSPDGNHVVFTWTGPKQDNTDLYVQQVGTGSHLRLTSDPATDYSPSWSPDGRSIAFLRRGRDTLSSELKTIAPLGGTERKVADIRTALAVYRPLSLSWCPDSTCVLVTDSPGDGTPDAIFVVSVETGEKRQLTRPRLGPKQRLVSDLDPVVSPDGRWVVFRRDNTPFTGEFFRLALKAGVLPDGEPVKLTPSILAGRSVWTADSREILFAERGALWRLDVLAGGSPTRLPFVGQDGVTPVLATTPGGGQRLIYVRSFADANIWRLEVPAPGAPATTPPVAAIGSPRYEDLPSLSADEQRLAFMSNRSGEFEVWVSDLDGSNALKLTSLMRLPGFPRWSPDGKYIAFHADPQERPDVLLVPSAGGKTQILTAATEGGAFPSFSRDGTWVYFSRNDAGINVLLKIPTSGGSPVRVTGSAATSAESLDGRDLYYTDAADRPGTLWRVALAGGSPTRILDGVIHGAFDVTEGGIYYLDRSGDLSGAFYADRPLGETRLQFFDFATRRITTVASNLGTVRPGLSATRNGRTIFFSRIDSAVDELMLVDNFR